MYSKIYFGKELLDLNYNDIENFFLEKKEESDKMEFKSYHEKGENSHAQHENNIIRSICGMLNSDGGIIIWGAPDKKKVDNLIEYFGELSPLKKSTDKDSLIRRISDNIKTTPRSYRMVELQKPDTQDYVIIFEIEKSEYAPHQYDNTYFMRIDGQTKPAPHHYVEALFKRISYPKLEGYVKVTNAKINDDGLTLSLASFVFNQSKVQNEEKPHYRLHAIKCSAKNISKIDGRIVANTLDLITFNPKEVLYANAFLVEEETFFINHKLLAQFNYYIDVSLYFGGKHSPLLVSRYKFKFSDNENYNLKNGSHISYFELNRSVTEIFEEWNLDNDKLVKSVMDKY